jgi:hypothetical protein
MNESRIMPRRPKTDRAALAVLCAALVTSFASASRADDQAENTAAARALGIQGVQLADAGKCPEAIEKLRRAETLHHAPTILERLGECQVNVGQIVEGTENLNAVVREQLPANAPQVFRDSQTRAQKVLATATPKIAHLTIGVAPPDAKPTVTVNGQPIPAALIGADRPTNPGTVEVSASADGYRAASQSVTLAEGGHQELTLTLQKDPNAVAALPPLTPNAGAAPAPVAPPPAAEKKSNVPAYVVLGVGGAGILVGGITGALALSKASDCPNKVCASQSDLDGAKSMATISTVGFAVGIVGIGLGTVLLLTGSKNSEAPTAATAAKLRPKLHVEPWIGVNSAGLRGAF